VNNDRAWPSSYAVSRNCRLGHWLPLLAIAAAACTPKNPVEYVDGQCLIGGVAATLAQVEARQAEVTQHILSRQPVLTAIAITAVVVAGSGYLRRILTMLAARRAPSQSFADRLRARLERYRAHPVRYFMLIGGVLAVIAAAGVAYVSLDADKRASERSLATLQFCHLALRSANEQHVLAEQREHLATIQSTEQNIRALVDQLPPAEQQKAREIAEQLAKSLGQQRTMVAQYAARADVAAKEVTEQQAEVQRGLSKLDGEVVDLKSMPAAVAKLANDVHDVGSREETLGGEIEACNAKLDTLAKNLDTASHALDTLANRPSTTCPVCACAATHVDAPSPTKSPAIAPTASSPSANPTPADAGT
jgi:hypothetical protein